MLLNESYKLFLKNRGFIFYLLNLPAMQDSWDQSLGWEDRSGERNGYLKLPRLLKPDPHWTSQNVEITTMMNIYQSSE